MFQYNRLCSPPECSYDKVALRGRELELLGELWRPCRVDILYGMVSKGLAKA
jgi:hypothetical protein